MAVIGRITVPVIAASGVFPLTTGYPVEVERDYRVVEHVMDSEPGNLKIAQRFLVGTGRPVHRFTREDLSTSEAGSLKTFFDAHKANHVPFTYNAPNADNQTFTAVTAVFAPEPLILRKSGGFTYATDLRIIEIPTSFPTYAVTQTATRFPPGGLASALTGQAQELIPLIHIVVKEAGHPNNIYLSDRECTIGGQLYQARLLTWSEITQAIDGQSDVSRFTFGNADRVMRDLAFDTDLNQATIEFSLFHVGTGIKLDVWKGLVSGISGHNRPEFTIEATDPIDLTVQYPQREISHFCWKTFNDGVNCTPPVTSPECDKTYSGTAGCQAHNNDRQFGGHFIQSELVHIKDNSTGFWGKMRRNITPSSIVADTAFGEALPLHFCDASSPLKVNARVMAGRDEGEFFIALGVVGQGPIKLSENAMDHRLNGQSAHGPGILGLRTSEGRDPASGGTFPSDNDNYFNLDQSTWPPEDPVFAAGSAFATIRIVDEKGIQPRAITEHQMQVTISTGTETWYWNVPGTRLAGPGMTNPVWVAVHCLLDALGQRLASAAAQEAIVDIPAAISAAAVNATVVNTLVGAGTETQFRAVGTVGERRAIRDWLQDICNSFLGYYTFAFGKFRIGSRINSSVVEAFTAGNIVRDSLEFERAAPQFNTITIEYADERYDFAKNTVTVELADHVRKYGRRATSMNLPFVSNRSQALRIGAIRLREECGGIDETEWKKRLAGAFSTTVLGIGTEPGMVISLTHPEMPGGAGEMRVKRWTLTPDYGLRLEWTTTTDSMYDLVVGPKPTDVEPDPLPVERIEEILPVQPWFANLEQPAAGDPIYPANDNQFRVTQAYETSGDVTPLPRIVVEGEYPVTRVIECDPPRIASVSTSSTGGTIAGGSYVTVCLVATDVVSRMTRISAAIGVQVPAGTNTNRITLNGITWPAECAGGGYRVYAAIDRAMLTEQGSATASQPSSITVTALTNVRTRGIPQPSLDGLVPRVRICDHLGINGLQITAIAAGSLTFAGAGWTSGQYVGRTVGIFADQSDGSAPLWHFEITANGADTLTVTPDPLAAGVQVGDIASILLEGNISSSYQIGDAALPNPQYPGGLEPDAEVGSLVLIVAGKGAGQERLITGNTETTLTVAPDWDIVPDATSWWVVVRSSIAYTGETIRVPIAEPGNQVYAEIPIENLPGKTILVEVVARDIYGRESEARVNARRFIYIFGNLGGVALQPPGNIQPIEGNAFSYTKTEDGTNAEITVTYSPPAEIGTFAGVYVVYVDPDGAVFDAGDYEYNGNPAGSGAARYGDLKFVIPQPASTTEYRVYVGSRSRSERNPLLQVGADIPTPSRLISVTALVSGGETPPPGDVTVGSPTITYYAAANGERRVTISIPYTAPGSGSFNGFNGVRAFSQTPTYDDATPLDPSESKLYDQGWNKYTGAAGGSGTAVVDRFAPDRAEGWKIYLAAGRDQKVKAEPWPATSTLSVGPAATLNVTSFAAGPAAYAQGNRALVIPFSFVLPSGASWDVLDWDRMEVHIRTSSMAPTDAAFVAAVFDRGTGNPGASVDSQIEIVDLPDEDETWTLAAVSFRLNGDRHSSAPTQTVNVSAPALLPAPDPVTGFTASVITSTDEAGGQRYRLEGSWTNPTGDSLFVGVEVAAVWAGDSKEHTLAIEKEGATTFRTDDWPMPESGTTVTVRAYAINADGKRSSAATVGLTLTPQATGTLKGNRLAASTLGAGLQNDGSVLRVPVQGINETLLADLAVTTGKLGNLAVNASKLADLAVEAAKLANSSVTATKIANAAVGSAAIANAAIGSAHIANAAVGTAQIADASITNAKILELAANKITAGTITASITMTAPTIDINNFGVRVQVDGTNWFKVTESSGTYTQLSGSIIAIDSPGGRLMQISASGLVSWGAFGSQVLRLEENGSGGPGRLQLNTALGTQKIVLDGTNGDAEIAGYLRVDGQLRFTSFFAHGTGDPASSATHKAGVYSSGGSFLGYLYLWP